MAGGYVAAWIAPRRPVKHALLLVKTYQANHVQPAS